MAQNFAASVAAIGANSQTTGSREPVVPRPTDVLLGRGKTRWGGNQLFDLEIQRNARRYRAAETRYDKTSIVREIIRNVQIWGRFLDQDTGTGDTEPPGGALATTDGLPAGDWYLATYVKIRKKVGQALRYQMEVLKYEASIEEKQQQQQKQQEQLMQQQQHQQKPMSNIESDSTGTPSSSKIPAARGISSESIRIGAQGGGVATAGMSLFLLVQQQHNYDIGTAPTTMTNEMQQPYPGRHNHHSHRGEENLSDSSGSLDVSLSAIWALEEQEAAEARGRGVQVPHQQRNDDIVSDAEILAFLGYTYGSNAAAIQDNRSCHHTAKQEGKR
ncbi:hypothetical protein ACA910_012425 [Epithemia clementina (nom. ined.)]